MSEFLNDTDRRQALAWYAVLGFNLRTIAEHYGLTPDQMSQELRTERKNREAAGKSTQPVPVRTSATGKVPTQAEVLIKCLTTLKDIVHACKKDTPRPTASLAWIKYIAESTLGKAGSLP